MKEIGPDYLREFHCIAGACQHTCCEGWDIEVDEESLPRFLAMPDIAPQISTDDTPHIRLLPGDSCPFLNGDGLCEMILKHGEDVLCQICRDHPRYRNYWSDRTELGLGLVCEEAGRLILGRETPMKLVVLSDDGNDEELPEDEAELLSVRDNLLNGITEKGPKARLLEYLIYRHIPDALYDDRLAARIRFVQESFREIVDVWNGTDGSLDALIECARQFSYDVEYDDEEKERRLTEYEEAAF